MTSAFWREPIFHSYGARLAAQSSRLVASTLLALIMGGSSVLASDSDFLTQCQKAYPIRDKFAEQCLKRAKPFSRYFYPSGREQYFAYIESIDYQSNFTLGCVLNFEHKINYVGLYYALQPTTTREIDNYKITFVDPNDNIGIEVNSRRRTFIAVRQFTSALIPARQPGAPENCSPPEPSAGSIEHLVGDRFRYCIGKGSDRFCTIESYTTRNTHVWPSVDQVIFADLNMFYITQSGQIVIKSGIYSGSCRKWVSDPLSAEAIIYEACLEAK